jgi:hypothetical protein
MTPKPTLHNALPFGQLTVSQVQALNDLIDARVEVRMAASKKMRKLPDPFGIGAQLEAARERDLRARIYQEEREAVYAPHIAASVAAGPAVKIPEMGDPLGLRAHGLNPDGTLVKAK